MTGVCNFSIHMIKAMSNTIALPAFLGVGTAVLCHTYAMTSLAAFIASAIVIPFITSAAVISILYKNDPELDNRLYSKAYAMGLLGIATIFQRNLPFITGGAAIAYWVIPKILVLKTGYELFTILDLCEFRQKPPTYPAK